MRPADNELLCRVEGEATMGRMMRRHWLPVCMVEEVAEPDGAPLKARLLGVDLVVFRDTKGRVGVMDERCPHRGRLAGLPGRNELRASLASTMAGSSTWRARSSTWLPSPRIRACAQT